MMDIERGELDLFRRLFNSIHHGAVIVDANGRVTHFNEPYGHFLGIDPRSPIGRHCTEVIENTRLHIVAQTGKPEINWRQQIKGQEMVVQRIPIKHADQVIAVFGQVMFKDIRDVHKLSERLSVLQSKVEHYEKELLSLRSTRYTLDSIIGDSGAMATIKKDALMAARSQLPVLITGESGTGKELFAQAIHHASKRRPFPFIRINCAAIPRELVESEFFGYEGGAFTGARRKGKPGKLELAHEGTVFLDEIGDLRLEVQPKLLRALEDKEFERVGGTSPKRTDFRVISATNRPLEQMLSEGSFREDLYFRLNVIPLVIPPLRRRRVDIPPLARHVIRQVANEAGSLEPVLDARAERALLDYPWPGNVRELTNVIERVMSTLESDTISLDDLPPHICHRDAASGPAPSTLSQARISAERQAILGALEACGNNKSQTAKRLGIHRTLLYKKMKKWGIEV